MKRSIVWFKTDLRLHDNETLVQAIQHSDENPQILVNFLDTFLDINNLKLDEKEKTRYSKSKLKTIIKRPLKLPDLLVSNEDFLEEYGLIYNKSLIMILTGALLLFFDKFIICR